jgi:hypothetical protein
LRARTSIGAVDRKSFDAVAAFRSTSVTITGAGDPERLPATMITATGFDPHARLMIDLPFSPRVAGDARGGGDRL